MSFYPDKYRPKTFAELTFNEESNKFLEALAVADNIPHIIIEGHRGSGKKTRLNAFLYAKYGTRAQNITCRLLNIDVHGKGVKELNAHISPVHYVIDPSHHGVYDRAVVHGFLSQVIGFTKGNPPIVVIDNADMLTIEAQESLRRTLETHISQCRFIFISRMENTMIEPIYSRCIRIRLSNPTELHIREIMGTIANAEHVCVVPENIDMIIQVAGRNLKKALAYLQIAIINNRPLQIDDIDTDLALSNKLVANVLNGESIGDFLKDTRPVIYDMLSTMNYLEIIPVILRSVISKIPKNEFASIYLVCSMARECDTTIRYSSKEMYHLEKFVLNIFKIIKEIQLRRSKPKKIESGFQTKKTPLVYKKKRCADQGN